MLFRRRFCYRSTEKTTTRLYTRMETRRWNLFDNRVPIVVRRTADSVACLMERRRLSGIGLSYRLNAPTLKDRVLETEKNHLAPGEAFSDEPSPGNGTAFLVSSRLCMTAAHLVCDKDGEPQTRIGKIRYLFLDFICLKRSKVHWRFQRTRCTTFKMRLTSLARCSARPLADGGRGARMLFPSGDFARAFVEPA